MAAQCYEVDEQFVLKTIYSYVYNNNQTFYSQSSWGYARVEIHKSRKTEKKTKMKKKGKKDNKKPKRKREKMQ
jgi:hypothetical protein